MSGVRINKDILAWSIKRADLKNEDLDKQFPKLYDWLEDKRKPTIKQLEAFSRKVHLPFGYFFLEQPPIESVPFPFFRGRNSQQSNLSINLFDTIKIVQRRQEWLSEYLQDKGEEPLKFVGKFSEKNNHFEIAEDIRNVLGTDLMWASAFSRVDEAINYLTGQIEDIGITMVFNGVVENSNNRQLHVSECRGFVIVDQIAPFMFINNADWKAAQMFTIAHELAHIWLGKSAGFENEQLLPADDFIEQLCDRIAAEFLVPEKKFISAWSERPDIQFLSRKFKVSRLVIARRALDLQKITRTQFFNIYNSFGAEIIRKKDDENGGNFYATQKKRIGLRFASYIDRAVNENKLLYRDAYKLIGIKGDTYENFMNKFLRA